MNALNLENKLCMESMPRTSKRRLHDAIPNKICNAIFADLLSETLIPCTTRDSQSSKEKLALRVNYTKNYYSPSNYGVAFQNAFYTALSELISTVVTACCNIKRQSPHSILPSLPNNLPSKASIYLLDFLVLKATLLYFFHLFLSLK